MSTPGWRGAGNPAEPAKRTQAQYQSCPSQPNALGTLVPGSFPELDGAIANIRLNDIAIDELAVQHIEAERV